MIGTNDSANAAMLIVHGWTIERARTVDADVVMIGQRRERDIGPGKSPAR